ncbi:hypothetical protein ACWIUD_01080 [Helicobacter sp. 23-1044]
MKKLLAFIFLACGVVFGEQIRIFIAQDDNIEIRYKFIPPNVKTRMYIAFEIYHNGVLVFKDKAWAWTAAEKEDIAENGESYRVYVYNNDGKCKVSLREQQGSLLKSEYKNPPKQSKERMQIRIENKQDKVCDSLKNIALENKIFYKINKD